MAGKLHSPRATIVATLVALLAVLGVVAVKLLGPGGAAGCRGIHVPPERDLVEVVQRAPAGTTICVEGFHRVAQPIIPKAGMTVRGTEGSIVAGSRQVTRFLPRGEFMAFPMQDSLPFRQDGRECTNYPLNCYRLGVFFDGIALTHVPREQLRPGTFFLDLAREEILLADDPIGHHVDVTQTSSIIRSSAPSVTVESLVVERAAGNGIVAGGPQWSILDVESRWNHAAGVRTNNSNFIVRGGHVHHNGQYGFTGGGSNGLIEGVEIDHNDQLLFGTNLDKGSACWDAGEAKWVNSLNLTIRNNHVHDGFCNGLWLDVNNRNTLIEGNRIENNAGIGLIHEIGFDATIQDNAVRGNGYFNIEVASSSGVRIYRNDIRGSGILILQQARAGAPRMERCSQGQSDTCERIARQITVSENRIACGSTCAAARSGGYAPFFDNDISFSGNQYYVQSAAANKWVLDDTRVAFETWVAHGFDTTSEVVSS
jgi:Right handed beta helix region